MGERVNPFAYDEQLQAWRREIEATLAFVPLEIDELEDHLTLSFEAKIGEGIPPEEAWVQAVAGIGSSRTLALEFAKNKLLPALLQLLGSWGWCAVLLVLFITIDTLGFNYNIKSDLHILLVGHGPGLTAVDWIPPAFWTSLFVTVLLVLVLLPQKERNAVLVGVGNSFCLLPILYELVYNSLAENWAGLGWARMGVAFPAWQILLGVGGLVILNSWWSRYSPSRTAVSIMACLVLVITVSPFFGEGVGNMTMLQIFQLPPSQHITYKGDERDAFLIWIFERVLVNSVILISYMVPLGVSLLLSVTVLALQIGSRSVKSVVEIFPARATVPLLMIFLTLGANWALSHLFEIGFSHNISEIENQMAQKSGHRDPFPVGLEVTVLLTAVGFIFCQVEVTKKMRASSKLCPFYSWLVVIIGGFGAVVILCLTSLLNDSAYSMEPWWLSMLLEFPVLFMAFYQVGLIWRKSRKRETQISLWQFEGADLARHGLLLGLVLAGVGLVFIMMSMVMSVTSVAAIGAMIQYGKAVTYHEEFNPAVHVLRDHFSNWIFYSVIYLSICMATGLGLMMALSGLEFIRFNSFRLYKVRSMRLAMN